MHRRPVSRFITHAFSKLHICTWCCRARNAASPCHCPGLTSSRPAGDLGFHNGRPLAAILIFRVALQWKAFQLDRTTLFDRIINAMGMQASLSLPLTISRDCTLWSETAAASAWLATQLAAG